MKTIMKSILFTLIITLSANAFDFQSAITKGTAILEGSKKAESQNSSLSNLSTSEISSGLKEALEFGIKQSIEQLSATDGFYGDSLVKILMPESMQNVAALAKKAGGEKYVNDFILAMNRAAEESVTEVAPIFAKELSSMSIEDAKNILTGEENAATAYFKQNAGPQIVQTVEPIIQTYMEENNVYRYYNLLKEYYDKLNINSLTGGLANSNLGAIASSVSGVALGDGKFPNKEELDSYMSTKTSDGIFAIIAKQEKEIRENLGARSTPLLQKVFGAL